MKLRFLVSLLLLSASTPLFAQLAIPSFNGKVVDTANLLSAQTENTLNSLVKIHRDSTSNELAILTIPSLQNEVVEDYAYNVAKKWKLGNKDRDNGVLLLVSKDDRKVRIEVGKGLEGALPDARAKQIIFDEMIPHFREREYDAGVLAGMEAIIANINGEYKGVPASEEDDWMVALIILFIFILFFFLIFRAAKKNPRRFNRNDDGGGWGGPIIINTGGGGWGGNSGGSDWGGGGGWSGGGGDFGGGGASGDW